ncbi:MAG: hypothetical protein IPO92_17955 [Saprospiraceae bacterium]|nr:hypothetical protein [Saprospiraceae bacterium]
MIFISENIINGLIDKYEAEELFMNDYAIMISERNDLSGFLAQENYSLLTKEEMALLEYLSCTIYFSSKEGLQKIPVLNGKTLEKWEEDNWDVFNSPTAKNFTKIIDIFFKDYPQEDLLALVEDSIQPDEENLVSSVGSEIIFVACKSIIDTLNQLN